MLRILIDKRLQIRQVLFIHRFAHFGDAFLQSRIFRRQVVRPFIKLKSRLKLLEFFVGSGQLLGDFKVVIILGILLHQIVRLSLQHLLRHRRTTFAFQISRSVLIFQKVPPVTITVPLLGSN